MDSLRDLGFPLTIFASMEGRWFSFVLGEEAWGPRWLKLTHKMKILLLRVHYYKQAAHPHCVSFALWEQSWKLPSRVVGQTQVKQRGEGVLSDCGCCWGWPCCPWTGGVTRCRPEERPRRTGAQRISKLFALAAPVTVLRPRRSKCFSFHGPLEVCSRTFIGI